ncbi:caspase family protein [Tenacibaculum aestuarii]|uniref:caspase family protein n=1 Tax=Tenacibaculum aestuarii TaxID=362781 RepID=UPI003892D21D
MIRKALIVGVDFYEKAPQLYGCVNDAHSIEAVLERDSDGTKNFQTKLITVNGPDSKLTRKDLKDNIKELFHGNPSAALFYFAGHGGYDKTTGGYLLTSESEHGDSGVPMSELLNIAHESKAQNKIIILDCCHAGAAGEFSINQDLTMLSDGMTILTATSADQYAKEKNGTGVFTNLLVDALYGSAANLLGQVTLGSAYAHIDQGIGDWGQRPIFRTNVKKFMPLRVANAPIPLSDLKMLTNLFPKKGEDYQLDPTYEPERNSEQKSLYPDPIEENTLKFEILQKYNRVNLVVPVDAPHMWHAAMCSKSCKLTALGERYWDLVKNRYI